MKIGATNLVKQLCEVQPMPDNIFQDLMKDVAEAQDGMKKLLIDNLKKDFPDLNIENLSELTVDVVSRKLSSYQDIFQFVKTRMPKRIAVYQFFPDLQFAGVKCDQHKETTFVFRGIIEYD